jgi:hypothetical protein
MRVRVQPDGVPEASPGSPALMSVIMLVFMIVTVTVIGPG